MAKFLGDLILPVLSSAPGSPVDGQTYIDATTDQINSWDADSSVWRQYAVTSAVIPTKVTSLPGSPADGQVCTFDPSGWTITGTAESVADVTWMLQYRSATSKWHFMGGDPLIVRVDTGELKTVGASYGTVTTAGPGITCAVAGDYIVQVGAFIAAILGCVGYISYDVGGTGAVDADAVRFDAAGNGYSAQGVSVPRRKTVAASTNILAKYKATTQQPNFANRWMSVLPIRMG